MYKIISVLFIVIAFLDDWADCQQSITIDNVIVNFLNRGQQTDFFVISNLEPSVGADAYLAVGLNSGKRMDGSSAVVCKNINGSLSIEHYYNNGYRPELMDTTNPMIGLSNTIMFLDSGYIICQFSRDNSYPGLSRYFDTNLNEAFLLYSYGDIINSKKD